MGEPSGAAPSADPPAAFRRPSGDSGAAAGGGGGTTGDDRYTGLWQQPPAAAKMGSGWGGGWGAAWGQQAAAAGGPAGDAQWDPPAKAPREAPPGHSHPSATGTNNTPLGARPASPEAAKMFEEASAVAGARPVRIKTEPGVVAAVPGSASPPSARDRRPEEPNDRRGDGRPDERAQRYDDRRTDDRRMDDRRMDGRMDPRMDERRGDVRMEERRGEDRRYDERRVDDRRGSDWREPEYGRVRELRDKSRDRRWNPEARDNRDPRAYADDRGRRQYDERDYREPQREREYDRRQQYDDRGYQHGSQPAYDDRQQRRDGDRYASPAPSHGSGGVPTGRPRGSSRDRNEQRRRSKSRSPTRVSLPFANGTADGPPPFSPQVPGSARPASDVPVAKQIEAKEAEKSELVRRRAALAVEMGALSTRITELDAEITNLYFLQGQRGGSVPAGEQVLSPGSSVRTLAANGDAGEADDGKRKRKKAAEAAEPGDLTADGDSEPRARPKKAARPAPADPTDDVVEEVEPAPASAAPKPFQPLSKKQQLKLSKPKTDMTTGVFGRVPRALLRCPKADMLVASSLDGSICFLDTNKGLPRIRIRDTLRRADLNNLPWAEDMDFIGLDLIAIAAAPKTTKNGNTITSPYKLGILQIPADLDQPTFSTMLYEPDVQPHNKDKSISCVTSPSFVFDGSDVDGIRFATGGTDRQVYLWNLRELQQGNPVPGKGMAKCSARLLNFGHGASVSDLKWDGRNQRLYSASSGELIAFDMNGERKVNTCKLDSAISGLCLSAASPDLLLVTLNSPQTKNNALFDTRKNEVVLRFGTPEPSGKANGHYRSALSPSGRLVASGTMYVGDTGGPVINCVWDLRWTGTRQNEPAARVKSMHKNAMQRFVWTSDQQFFSTSTGDGIECVEFATASG